MPTHFDENDIENCSSLELLDALISDIEMYLKELVLCIRNIDSQYDEYNSYFKTLKGEERKDLTEAFENIHKVLTSMKGKDNLTIGLKLFEESVYTKFLKHAKPLLKKYEALLSGVDINPETQLAFLEEISKISNETSKIDQVLSPALMNIIKHFGKIAPPSFNMLEKIQKLGRILNEINILNGSETGKGTVNLIFRALQERSIYCLVRLLWIEARRQKCIISAEVDFKKISEKFKQDRLLSKIMTVILQFLESKDIVDKMNEYEDLFEESSENALQLDSIHPKMERVHYLDQGYSLRHYHGVGYCLGDIRFWNDLPFSKPIKKKLGFNEISDLHSEDANEKVMHLQINQSSFKQRNKSGSHLFFSIKKYEPKEELFDEEETETETLVKSPNLMKYFDEMLNPLVGISEKYSNKGTLQISFTAEETAGHSIGIKIAKVGLKTVYFVRDINCGEFYCEDFSVLKFWFSRYFCTMDYHEEYNGFEISFLSPKTQESLLRELNQKLPRPKISEIESLAPLLMDETRDFEIGLTLITLYNKIKEKTETDHFIAFCAYTNCSEQLLDNDPKKREFCEKAYQISEMLARDPHFKYEPINTLLNLGECYIKEPDLKYLGEGLNSLMKACDLIAKIQDKEILCSEDLKVFKELAEKLKTKISIFMKGKVNLFEVLSAQDELDRFLQENSDVARTSYVQELSLGVFERDVKDIKLDKDKDKSTKPEAVKTEMKEKTEKKEEKEKKDDKVNPLVKPLILSGAKPASVKPEARVATGAVPKKGVGALVKAFEAGALKR